LGRSMAGGVLNRLGGRTGDELLPVQAGLIAPNGRTLWLRRARALVGRADETLGYPVESLDAELTEFDPDRTVSRPHALIVYADGNFSVRDLYSQSGVLVNGIHISPSQAQLIYDGDVLTFGSVALQFHCES
jgi:pSer/pThr/pTyr-binding forkhead associated (FHA) protein